MVTLRTSSHELEDAAGRPRKMPRGPPLQHDAGVGMPPIPINRGHMSVGPHGVPGGPPSRTTATSRRGGRTRARSPIVAAGTAHPQPSGLSTMKGENPSTAAAAAAAAAKAYSDSGGHAGRSGPWSHPEHYHEDRTYHPSMGGYGPRGGSKNWPPGAPDGHKSPGGHYSQHAYSPYGGPYDNYRGEPYPHGDRRYRGPPGERHHHASHRGTHPESRGPMYHHHPHPEYHQRGYMGGGRGDHRQHPPPGSKSSRTPPPPGGHGAAGGSRSLVIGGTTPIHVPKPKVHPEPAERPTRASAASVFRGRSGSEPTSPKPPSDTKPKSSEEQKGLLSLKTPTSSFEEKKTDDAKAAPMSPKGPPQLHSTSQQRTVDMFERSPEAPKQAPSIDINPSFTLFNQSFDSLGDNYLGVESTLNAESFGMVGGGMVGGSDADNALRTAFSTGNGSTQLLAPSASGHLSLGYSPVNSFGNVSSAPPPRRSGSGGNMMLLGGGPDERASSPTQVLSSYSQGYGARGSGPLDDGHLRMGGGSFGGPSYGRPPYMADAGPQFFDEPEKFNDGAPHFYSFLRKYKEAFAGCSFVLPGLKSALLEISPTDKKGTSGNSDKKPSRGYPDTAPSTQDLVIAQRRVESSVCAFGGSHFGLMPETTRRGLGSNPDSSIFRGREKDLSPEEQKSATVTPSSSVASPPRSSKITSEANRKKYEDELPGRYYENESRLSWEFEENPPVEVSDSPIKSDPSSLSMGDRKESTKSSDEASVKSRLGTASPPASKMRYRCKLCGQPKQNHTCPYQQSLARSIGLMVYPAVNAFTAAEPGSLAPPLSEMNNFTDIVSEKGSVTNESSPGRTSAPIATLKQVTPESARASPRQVQVASLPDPSGKTPNRSNTSVRRGRKRGYDHKDDQGDLLFLEGMELKPQQFLSVSQDFGASSSGRAFTYPSLPLPYAQRKRLSDNLFSLSNEVPKLTDECAQVLREAREKDKWDLAVAELMTQVIVVLHCRDGDSRFEGLRQYLLTLGIAC